MKNILLSVWLMLTCTGVTKSTPAKNVLFIAIDDLRPELEPYVGKSDKSSLFGNIHTPNIEALAKRSIVFQRSYVQYPLCAPSRASLLTGRRPDTTNIYGFNVNFRDAGGNFTTIPQYFKTHGYHTVGIGKIFHLNPEKVRDWDVDPLSWSEPFYHPPANKSGNSWQALSDAEIKASPLFDIQVADKAIEKLETLSEDARSGTKPFFLAAGFYKPHLPIKFPKSFLKYYPKESIHLPTNMYVPNGMPKVAWTSCGGLSSAPDIRPLHWGRFNSTLPPTKILELRRAYYSAVTFVDSLVGRILNKLNELGLDKNTVVVLWGDHGWHLGEHGMWCKQTSFEVATRAPLMFSIPGITDSGIETNELVEHVDIFPTLLEATGHNIPDTCPLKSRDIELCVEGKSLMPLVKSPKVPLKNAVFYQVKRKRTQGYSIKTKLYRYTVWLHWEKGTKTDWKNVQAKELYDHGVDPRETENVVENRKYESIVNNLHNRLKKGWRSAIINDDIKSKLSDETHVDKDATKYVDASGYYKSEVMYSMNDFKSVKCCNSEFIVIFVFLMTFFVFIFILKSKSTLRIKS